MLARRDRFRFRIGSDPDAVWERLLQHPAVRVSNEPAPEPAPPDGPPVLVVRRSERELRVRMWAGSADATSPVVVVRFEPDAGAWQVEGHFEHRGSAGPLVGEHEGHSWGWYVTPPLVLATLVLIAQLVLGWGPASIFTVLLLLMLFGVPAAAVMIPGLLMWDAQSRQRQTRALWTFVGELFTPLALASAPDEDPFR